MLFKKYRSEKVADSTHDLFDTVKDRLSDSDRLSHAKGAVTDRAHDVKDALSDVDTERMKNQAKDTAAAAKGKAAKAAGLTREQAQDMFADEWMPKIQHALHAVTAATAASVAKLPEPAQQQVAKVAPDLVAKPKKGGKLFIVVGLACLAGAGYVYWQGQQKKGAHAADSGFAGSSGATSATPTVEHVDDAVGEGQERIERAIAADAPESSVSTQPTHESSSSDRSSGM